MVIDILPYARLIAGAQPVKQRQDARCHGTGPPMSVDIPRRNGEAQLVHYQRQTVSAYWITSLDLLDRRSRDPRPIREVSLCVPNSLPLGLDHTPETQQHILHDFTFPLHW